MEQVQPFQAVGVLGQGGTGRVHFQSEAAGQREAPRIGFGTEASWGSATADWTCVLAVREGNLSVWLGLRAKPYTRGACETRAKDAARAALKAARRS